MRYFFIALLFFTGLAYASETPPLNSAKKLDDWYGTNRNQIIQQEKKDNSIPGVLMVIGSFASVVSLMQAALSYKESNIYDVILCCGVGSMAVFATYLSVKEYYKVFSSCEKMKHTLYKTYIELQKKMLEKEIYPNEQFLIE